VKFAGDAQRACVCPIARGLATSQVSFSLLEIIAGEANGPTAPDRPSLH
jgi:hypothetical protein